MLEQLPAHGLVDFAAKDAILAKFDVNTRGIEQILETDTATVCGSCRRKRRKRPRSRALRGIGARRGASEKETECGEPWLACSANARNSRRKAMERDRGEGMS